MEKKKKYPLIVCLYKRVVMSKFVCLFLVLFFFEGCATTQSYWYNSNPQLQNQDTLNRHTSECKEYSIQATMNMPTKVSPSGYNIDYYQIGNTGYGSVTPKRHWSDSVAEMNMFLKKENREKEAYNKCMISKGWYLAKQNAPLMKDNENQSTSLNYQGQIIFQDNFDNNVNGWIIEDNNNAALQIQTGAYIFENKRNDNSYVTSMRFNNFSTSDMNFGIEVSIEKISGVDSYGYGLIFGKDSQNYYVFYIASNGHYAIAENINGITSPIIPWKKTSISNTGNSTNQLLVKKNGDITRFYINNKYVDEVSNLYYYGSTIGFVIERNQKIAIHYLTIAK